MPLKAKVCPFCNEVPKITPYPNNLGAQVECTNPECEMWGHKFDLDGWNHRKNIIRDVLEYLFNTQVIFQSANFKKVIRYVCKSCGMEARTKKAIAHKEDCKIRRFLQNAS